MANDFLDLIPDFIEEAQDHLGNIEEDILAIESSVTQAKPFDLEAVNRVFRAIHSIKGGSAFIGLSRIEELAHAIENILNFLRNGDLTLSSELISVMLAAIDRLKTLIAEGEKSSVADVSPYIGELKKLTNRSLDKKAKTSAERMLDTHSVFDGVSFQVSEYTIERKLKKGTFFLIKLNTVSDIEREGRNLIDFIRTLTSFGEIVDSQIDINRVGEEELSLAILFYSLMDERALKLALPMLPQQAIRPITPETLARLIEKIPAKRATAKKSAVIPAEVPVKQQERKTEAAQAEAFLTKPHEMEDQQPESEDTDWEKYKEFVTFFVGGEQYAVPIFIVHDIKEMLPYSLLPNQPGYVIGVINLRGNVVPIFDMRKKLGLNAKPFDRQTVILILDIRGKMKGCVVDSISDVVVLEAQHKQSTPMLSRNINIEFVKFIGKDPKSHSFLIVLDIDKILTND